MSRYEDGETNSPAVIYGALLVFCLIMVFAPVLGGILIAGGLVFAVYSLIKSQ